MQQASTTALTTLQNIALQAVRQYKQYGVLDKKIKTTQLVKFPSPADNVLLSPSWFGIAAFIINMPINILEQLEFPIFLLKSETVFFLLLSFFSFFCLKRETGWARAAAAASNIAEKLSSSRVPFSITQSQRVSNYKSVAGGGGPLDFLLQVNTTPPKKTAKS